MVKNIFSSFYPPDVIPLIVEDLPCIVARTPTIVPPPDHAKAVDVVVTFSLV